MPLSSRPGGRCAQSRNPRRNDRPCRLALGPGYFAGAKFRDDTAVARYDFKAQRLFVDGDLTEGAAVTCSAEQANYLRNVLRLKPGGAILVFNGRHGEWQAELAEAGKRGASLVLKHKVREQEGGPDIDYLFAPLKRARLDYMVQKATEMGAARLRPVLTRHTTPERVNSERDEFLDVAGKVLGD